MNGLNRWARAPLMVGLLALGSCGGGGGSGPDETVQAASCSARVEDYIGVCPGFPDSASLDWTGGGGDGGGDGGVGAGASGDGGVGAGGDFGQFKKATIRVFREDGTLLGEALTDDVKGMVTIRPGKAYRGGLRVELRGGPGAEYFEEGKNRFVPFPADRVIRVAVPRIDKNIGITIFTEAAYQLLTQGSAPESVTGTPTAAQVRAANQRVASVLNKQFPSALAVDDITRLPFIKSPTVAAGAFNADKRGIYGVVSGTFSKQAALFNTGSDSPTLDALDQLAEDLKDGQLDGTNRGAPAGRTNRRTYDPNTLAGELTAALSHQAERFGSAAIKATLPPVVNFGGTRYQGYLFDGQISKSRTAISTVAGWLADNSLGLTVGQGRPKALPAGQSATTMISNFGHGGAFFKIDSTDTTATPVYRVYALGDNVNGELGTGNRNSTNSQLVEVTLPGPLTHAAGGFAHTLLRLADGRVFTMGDNTYGQLGQSKDSGALASSSTPLEVALPAAAGGAVAVAATSVASYALMADGSVYAWGSNGGFGLLGNGSATGAQTAPAKVAALSDIVQISARDNDVVVLKRDQSIWQWGSHPADVGAYTDGDVTSAYRGGTLVPVAVTGLPTATTGGTTAPIPVRKIITEQGLFAALLDNGHVYTWGVHFDLSAKAVLRDLTAARVLGLPPLRDLMPGGFVGYGARPFDRLTGMGIDYDGGMWKIRGRVAESFDPANPTVQRRPQTGLARSANCASCHTFLDDTMGTLRARQAAEAPVPASAAVCAPPSSVHVATNGQSLIRAETECLQCHNPARLNPAYAGTLTPAFASSGGWPNCNKPTTLPPRDNVPAEPITTSCIVPAFHVFTPPGTVCSSCHNSVVARALQDLSPPCAQPGSAELPQLSTVATLVGATEDDGTPIAQGAYTRKTTPRFFGTLNTALVSGQGLAVERNGKAIGYAATSGANFTYVDPAAPQGTVTYALRAVNGSGQFGPLSNMWVIRVDSIAPAATPTITALVDDTLGTIADGGFSTDTTPTLNGTLSVAPGVGESLEVLRNGTPVAQAVVTDTSWTFTEATGLLPGSYAYVVRLADAAGNRGTPSAGRSVTLIAGVGTASITAAFNDALTVIAAGSATSDNTPQLRGTLSAALPAGHVVAVLRNGTVAGTAAVSGLGWSFTDNAPEGNVSYTAQVRAGAVTGAEGTPYAFFVDSIAPTQTVVVAAITDRFGVTLPPGGTTADGSPTISGTLSGALAGGESLQIIRTPVGGGAAVLVNLNPAPTGTNWTYTESSLLAAGTYDYQARVFDAAGNVSVASAARRVTVDPSAVPLPGAAATIATINGFTPSGGTIGLSTVSTPVLAGSIGRALAAGEVVKIFRNGVPVANATIAVGASAWTYTNSTLADGAYSFTAQVQQAASALVFGQMSAAVSVTIDATPPGQIIGGMNIADAALISVSGSNTTSTSVTLTGNMSANLGAGEVLQLVRVGASTGTLTRTVTGATAAGWSFPDSSLAVDSYAYTARVRDAAGNLGASSTLTVNVIAALPTVSSIAVTGATGGFVGTATPTVTGTLFATLPGTPAPGGTVRIFRNGASAGTATASGTSFTFIDSTRTEGSTVTYTARVENGTAYSATSSGVVVTIDTTAPAQTASVLSASSSVMPNTTVGGAVPPNSAIANGGTTNDNSPRLNVQLSGPLGTGEFLRVKRGTFTVGIISVGSCGTNCFIVDVPSPVTLTNNEFGGISGIPPSTAGLPTAAQAYTAMVVDALGREGTASAAFNIVFNYFPCDITRANATYGGTGHPSWTGLTCSSSCHTNSNPASPTPSGTMIRVASTTPSYWCRRP